MAEETHADKVRRLSKEWIETGDDIILDELQNCFQDDANFILGSRGLLERYKNGGAELHVHFLGQVFGHWDEDICAVLRYSCAAHDTEEVSEIVGESDLGLACGDSGKQQGPVLINVYEVAQDPQGMILRLKLGVEVRLQLLNECFRLNGHPAKSVVFELPIKSVLGETDRKRAFLGRGMFINENQLPNEVIKRGAEIVKAITDEDAQGQAGCSLNGESKPARIHVSLTEDAAIINNPGGFLSNGINVYVSPDEFFSNTVERMVHKCGF